MASPQTRDSGDAPLAIEVLGLQKGYGDLPVLWDLDLSLGWGEFLVLFGSNGSGKATLLRVLSGQPSASRPPPGGGGFPQWIPL